MFRLTGACGTLGSKYQPKQAQWLVPVTPVTQEAKSRRISITEQPGENVSETLACCLAPVIPAASEAVGR
jgi:hypothetical protein